MLNAVMAYFEFLIVGRVPHAPTRKQVLDAFGVSGASELPNGGKFDLEKVLKPSAYRLEAVRAAAVRLKDALCAFLRKQLVTAVRLLESKYALSGHESLEELERVVIDLRADLDRRILNLSTDLAALYDKLGEACPRLVFNRARSNAELLELHDRLCDAHAEADQNLNQRLRIQRAA